MTWISYRGIEISAQVQNLLVYVQYGVLVLFAWCAGERRPRRLARGRRSRPRGRCSTRATSTRRSLIAAVVLGVFLFWGWESTLSVNEETENPDNTPGRAALISTVLLLVTYVGVTGVVSRGGTGDGVLDLSDEAVAEGSADDVFTPLAETVGPWLAVLVGLAIVVSACRRARRRSCPRRAACCRWAPTRRCPRASRASTRDSALPASPRWHGHRGDRVLRRHDVRSARTCSTTRSTRSASPSRSTTRSPASAACGTSATTSAPGATCSPRVLPVLGALALTFVFVRSAIDMYDPENSYTTLFGVGAAFVLGIGGLVLGVVLMVVLRHARPAAFFRGEALNRDTAVLVPETEHAVVVGHEIPAGAEVDPDTVENMLEVLADELAAEHDDDR